MTDLNNLVAEFFVTNDRYEAAEILDYLDGIVLSGTQSLLEGRKDLDEIAKITLARELLLKLKAQFDYEYQSDTEEEDE